MGLFTGSKEPVFLKKSNTAQRQLEALLDLEPHLNEEGKLKIRQEIKNIECGIVGERNIEYELKNSHMYMYILHDVYLQAGDLSAQIDYLVFTKKLCFIVECKNLYGDIEINNRGEFIRTMEFGGRKKKEGIYSPITQNQRHLELLKKIRIDNSKNILVKLMAGKYFEEAHMPIVVLANPKTVLNAKYAKKEIKQKVISSDQLVQHIKQIDAKSKEIEFSESRTLKWAQIFLNFHKEVERDYTTKYEKYKSVGNTDNIVNDLSKQEADIKSISIPIENTNIYKELRAYRLFKSRKEDIKPYFIYNNNQLKDLISKMPITREQLLTVQGFAESKALKYGEDIIQIIRKYL